MPHLLKIAYTCCLLLISTLSWSQRGKIIQTASTSVMDPNGDGYVSQTNSGFSNDGYYVDEFEIPMFGIPFYGDGEALNDTQIGPNCGTTDLTVDSKGHSVYAVLDNNNNLIFRFRLANERPSVEAYTILIDTDGKIGPSDPNYSTTNPGFEIDITLIKSASQGVRVYNIDGVSGCPTPIRTYAYSSHVQIAIADLASCSDQDYFYDFYVPFADLTSAFGITTASKLQFAAVTNISGTCALAGKISDISGVNDNDYDGCNYCAFEDLASNQCPVALDNLCATCEGFLSGATPMPTMEIPLKEGDSQIKGTADPEAEIFLDIYSNQSLIEQLVLPTDLDGNWLANLAQPLVQGDSVTAVAQLYGKCDSGVTGSQLSYAVVVLNTIPALVGTNDPLTYIENSGIQPIEPGILVSDNEDLDLESATIRFIDGYVPTEDLLSFTNTSILTGSYNATTGTMTITGDGTLDQYQTALRNVGYSNSSDNPVITSRLVEFVVWDGTGESLPYSREIVIQPVNDPPVISGTPGTTAYNWVPMIINSSMSVSDVDDPVITGGQVRIGTNFQTMEDYLLFVAIDGIGVTGMYDEVTGILTLSGTASFSDYAQVLNTIQYEYQYDTDASTLTRRIDFRVTDGKDFSLAFSHFITLATDNNPPVITDEDGFSIDNLDISVDEDTPGEFCLNVTDPEDDPVILESEDPANGTVEILGGLCFRYTPDPNFNGTETFQLTVTDQGTPPLSDVITVTVTVNPVNDAPTVNPLSISVDEKTTTDICVTVNDIEGDDHQFSSATASHGTVEPSSAGDLCFAYTPTNGYQGPDVIQVTICDKDDPTVCGTGTVTVNVQDVNEPPIILVNSIPSNEQFVTTNEDTPLEFCFEVVDPESDDASFGVVNQISGTGDLVTSLTEFCMTYTPEANATGNSVWTVEVCDDQSPSLCSILTVTIEVLPINDPPEIIGTTGTTNYPWTAVVIHNGLSITDVDNTLLAGARIELSDYLASEDFLRFSNTTDITGEFNTMTGILTLTGDASLAGYAAALNSVQFEYLPTGNAASGTRTARFYVSDGTDESLAFIQTIDITVNNNAPVIVDEEDNPIDNLTVVVSEDSSGNFCLNVNDPDGDDLILTSEDPTHGTVTLTGGLCFDYEPDPDYYGEDTFIMTVCDDNIPSLCDEVLVTVVTLPVNDAPVISADLTSINYPWEPIQIMTGFSVSDIDDTHIESAIIEFTSGFVPDQDVLQFANQNGISGFYNSASGALLLTGSATLANYQAAIESITYHYLYEGYPIDSDRLLTILLDDGDLESNVLTQRIQYLIDNSAPDVLDEEGTNTTTITLEMDEDTEVEFCLNVVDIDGDNATLSLLATDLNATASISDAHCFTITPEENFFGSLLYEARVCDDNAPSLCTDITITINVLPINDAPVANRDELNIKRAVLGSINVLSNDQDIENDNLSTTITAINGPYNGSATISADGTVTYQSLVTYRGPDSLRYEVRDSGNPSLSAIGTLYINVTDDPFTVYQAISPNGDGLNDYWHIEGIDYYPNNLVRLYDRYQNLVFEMNGYNNNDKVWRGQANRGMGRSDLAEGTYFYYISLGREGGTKSGYIYLKAE